jgi:hypothetical protein
MTRITANLPWQLENPVKRKVKAERYPSESAYGVGVLTWDVYSRQPHLLTGPLLQEHWVVVNAFVEELLVELGEPKLPTGDRLPYRFTVTVPAALMPLVRVRVKELRYKSLSAYVSGLIIFDLKRRTPTEKGVPHHKTAPLMREPDWIRKAVFTQLAEDFGNPDRRWPHGIEGRIDELISLQRELPLKP